MGSEDVSNATAPTAKRPTAEATRRCGSRDEQVWTALEGVAPLAQVTDVGRLRYLRQRALYSIMFHGTQRELLDRMTPNIVPAQVYLAGASSVVPPFPAVTG